jgi:hypothetical protein
VLGSGMTAIQASMFPFLRPFPTMVRPSADTPVAMSRVLT